ncbi:MAG: DUF302 domain-containing protein [Gammaproteobacteria bacterium]|nr:DUF302 domain-containing protein [Gammaproteobacteria bacterium]
MLLSRKLIHSIIALAMIGSVHAQAVPPNVQANPLFSMQQNWMNFQWMNMMAQHFMTLPMDEATRFGVLDAMLRAVNTNMMLGMKEGANQSVENVPALTIPMFPTQSKQNFVPNTVSGSLSAEAKRNLYQTMMMTSPFSMRDMISIMADKMEVAEDVTFDDAIESMKLRANEVNFKFVGHSPLYKDVEAITGEPTPRVEIFHFCDAMVARSILDYAPEFVVYLPCRIALLEDAEGKLWVMTLDWNVNWLNFAQNPNSVLDKKLREDAERIRTALHYIMEGAATGDF